MLGIWRGARGLWTAERPVTRPEATARNLELEEVPPWRRFPVILHREGLLQGTSAPKRTWCKLHHAAELPAAPGLAPEEGCSPEPAEADAPGAAVAPHSHRPQGTQATEQYGNQLPERPEFVKPRDELEVAMALVAQARLSMKRARVALAAPPGTAMDGDGPEQVLRGAALALAGAVAAVFRAMAMQHGLPCPEMERADPALVPAAGLPRTPRFGPWALPLVQAPCKAAATEPLADSTFRAGPAAPTATACVPSEAGAGASLPNGSVAELPCPAPNTPPSSPADVIKGLAALMAAEVDRLVAAGVFAADVSAESTEPPAHQACLVSEPLAPNTVPAASASDACVDAGSEAQGAQQVRPAASKMPSDPVSKALDPQVPSVKASCDIPELGDLIRLRHSMLAEQGLRLAVVTKVAERHCTCIILDKDLHAGITECWPSYGDFSIEHSAWRLGARVMFHGLTSSKNAKLNGFIGTIVVHPREGHPGFITKPANPDRRELVLCVRMHKPKAAGVHVVMLEPRYMSAHDPAVPPAPQSLIQLG